VIGCANCGHQVHAEAVGCPHCGADPRTGVVPEPVRRLEADAARDPAWPTWRLLALTGGVTGLVLAFTVLWRGDVWATDMIEGVYMPSNPMVVTAFVWLISACLAFVACATPKVNRRRLCLVFGSAAGGFVGAAISGAVAHLGLGDVSYRLADPRNHAQLALVWSLAALQLVVSGVLMLRGRETVDSMSR
jgi:hypothetical protein